MSVWALWGTATMGTRVEKKKKKKKKKNCLPTVLLEGRE